MSEWEVTIAESVAPGGSERVSSPMVRTVDWRGEADSEEAARAAAWHAWDERYGADRERPAEADVHANKVPD
jgi:hypothetical protein